jgi:hypothetical protein
VKTEHYRNIAEEELSENKILKISFEMYIIGYDHQANEEYMNKELQRV